MDQYPQNLSGFLQHGGIAAFKIRFLLAATVGTTYGMYGPAFEFCQARALPDSEEYADSEQFQLKHWDWNVRSPLHDLITLVNRLRREHKALQVSATLRFHPVSNDQLIAYSKHDGRLGDPILVVVNLDPHHAQGGWLDLALESVGQTDGRDFEVRDLLTNTAYYWRGRRNYVELDPLRCPAHLFAICPKAH